jgi:uncharacterized membrane protein YqjE
MGDPDAPGRMPGGLFDSLRTLIATMAAMAHTRVELLGTELEEELHRVIALTVGAIVVLALASLALLFGGLVVVAAFWETHRVAAVVCVAVGFFALAVMAYVAVRVRTGRRLRLLSATLGQLEQDMQQLGRRPSP